MEWNGIPWEVPASALLVFLGIVSGVEALVRGSRATRWKDSLILLGASAISALLGGTLMARTAVSVPSWRQPSPGSSVGSESMAWDHGFLGGAMVGLAASGLIVASNRWRPSWPSLPTLQILRHHAAPFTGAVISFTLVLAFPGRLWDWLHASGAPGTVPEIRVRVLSLACIAGTAAGALGAAWRVLRCRSSML